ncbi:hypothetical protein GDO78_013838 [Eleutherodactylus coqui]|uniref:Ig-like domain-containing protein n=1 Tax=Eleutherodactylus coqui TaxID=57060 RepID=A0A8J6EF98_ELECQ|nr:hypothetical protein GDO78_013838 [Eleutherodactylus coqui]
MKINNVFHKFLLKRFIDSGNDSPPPAPVLVDGEEQFVISRILDSRRVRNSLQYLVHWRCYGPEERSWVPAADVHADHLVKNFHRSNPGRPGPKVPGAPSRREGTVAAVLRPAPGLQARPGFGYALASPGAEGCGSCRSNPGKPVIIKDRKLKQRLQGTDQGSLEIIDVYLEDQGEYSATVFKEKNNDCVQHFRVNVYPKLLNEDIEIKSTVSGKEPCNVTLTCAVNRSDVTIFWSSQSESNTVIRDHTLTLYNVHPNSTYSCTAENPAIKTSRSIKPWIFCLEDTATYSFNLAGSHPIWTPVLVMMMFIVGPVLYS